MHLLASEKVFWNKDGLCRNAVLQSCMTLNGGVGSSAKVWVMVLPSPVWTEGGDHKHLLLPGSERPGKAPKRWHLIMYVNIYKIQGILQSSWIRGKIPGFQKKFFFFLQTHKKTLSLNPIFYDIFEVTSSTHCVMRSLRVQPNTLL